MGGRVLPAFAAVEEPRGTNPEIFIIERLARGGDITDEDAADFIRDARRVAELEHPNVGRVREVAIRSEELLVACDFVPGEPLSSVLSSAPPSGRAPLDVLLRVLVDALTGLGALHNLRDVKRQPLKLVHGELTPANVVVGTDGAARIVHVCRVRATAARAGHPGAAYLAPEVLLDDGSADARADVYSIGAILWEALAGKRLFPDESPHAIVAQLLSRKTPLAPTPRDAPWAADLVGVAAKALGADPQSRFISAAAMTAEIRRIAGAKLATAGRVATFVKTAFGAEIAARRERILASSDDRVTAPPPPKGPSLPPPSGEEIEISVDEVSARPPPMPRTAPPGPPMPTPPPPPAKTAIGVPITSPFASAPPLMHLVSPFDAPPTRTAPPVQPVVPEVTRSAPAAIAPFTLRAELPDGQRTTSAFVAPHVPSSRPADPSRGRRRAVVAVVVGCVAILALGVVRTCATSGADDEPLGVASAGLPRSFEIPTATATTAPTPTPTPTIAPIPTAASEAPPAVAATPTANPMPYPRTNTFPITVLPAPSAHPAHPHAAYDPQGI
jgi:serine/threonine protein kinase